MDDELDKYLIKRDALLEALRAAPTDIDSLQYTDGILTRSLVPPFGEIKSVGLFALSEYLKISKDKELIEASKPLYKIIAKEFLDLVKRREEGWADKILFGAEVPVGSASLEESESVTAPSLITMIERLGSAEELGLTTADVEAVVHKAYEQKLKDSVSALITAIETGGANLKMMGPEEGGILYWVKELGGWENVPEEINEDGQKQKIIDEEMFNQLIPTVQANDRFARVMDIIMRIELAKEYGDESSRSKFNGYKFHGKENPENSVFHLIDQLGGPEQFEECLKFTGIDPEQFKERMRACWEYCKPHKEDLDYKGDSLILIGMNIRPQPKPSAPTPGL
jgi:hypothetical protein